MSGKSKRILEADIIRLVLIVMLVLYHAFAPWSMSWEPLEGQNFNYAYWWVAKSSYSFFLECFVFLSGYLMGYQSIIKGAETLDFRNMVQKKFQRLIIPSIIFSLIYLLCFGIYANETMGQAVYSLINGRGHMWFLPMLFWCFIGLWIINKIKLSDKILIPVLMLLAMVNFLPLPVRMGQALYYVFFFYLGYIFKFKYGEVLANISKPVYSSMFSIGYIIISKCWKLAYIKFQEILR